MFRSATISEQPRRTGTMATHGGVRSALQANGFGEEPFHAVPKTNAVEYRIQDVGHGAVMAVLWVRVMAGMMLRGLEDVDALKEGNDRPVFGASAMGPLMHLVGIRGHNGKEPHRPRKRVAEPRDEDDKRGEQRQVPRALPPIMARHVTWVMMMDDVRPRDVPADERSVFADVGVFKPMDDAREKFSGKNGAYCAQHNEDWCEHKDFRFECFYSAVRS